MATAASIVLIPLFGLWYALTLIHQFLKVLGNNPRGLYDPLQLVPTWTFFAPLPVSVDYHVLYRDYRIEGQASEWKELNLLRGGTRAFIALWNPQRRIDKAIIDLSQALLISSDLAKRKNQPLGQLALSIPYLAILNLVVQAPRELKSVSRQFMIVETYPSRPDSPIQVVFRSAVHSLSRA
jgi:hypothetical protein